MNNKLLNSFIQFGILVGIRYAQMSLKDRLGKDFLDIAMDITNKRCSKRTRCSICETQPYTYDPIEQVCLYCKGMKPYKKKRKNARRKI